MINQDLVDQIITEINILEDEFQSTQGMILTEDDLKCHLFSKIKSIVNISQPTIDRDVMGCPLHSEVKFFDENGKLTLIPDLTIISPSHLSIFHSVEFSINNNTFRFKKYSSKSFEIGGNAIIIELKFCRTKSGLSARNIQSYQADIDKISRLQNIINHRSAGHDKLYGIFVLFNKTNKGKLKFDAFQAENYQHPSINILYKTGNVDFSEGRTFNYNPGFLTERVDYC